MSQTDSRKIIDLFSAYRFEQVPMTDLLLLHDVNGGNAVSHQSERAELNPPSDPGRAKAGPSARTPPRNDGGDEVPDRGFLVFAAS